MVTFEAEDRGIVDILADEDPRSVPAEASTTALMDHLGTVVGATSHQMESRTRLPDWPDACIGGLASGGGVLSCQRVVLARGGCDARQGGFDGGRFIIPDVRRKMASDAILVDRRRALQRFLAAGGEHDEQAATIPGRRRSLHEASLLDPIDQPGQATLAE